MEEIIINGCKIDDDFITEYELYKESVRGRLYGKMYKVFIELNEEGIKAGKMEEFAAEYPSIQLNDRAITVIWEVPDDEGVHEIEIALYYDLENGEYGTYSWECIKAN
ncbi:hypothetical protein GGQ92_002236 [Gracilibacillus halotolerans]|uniref:Uncharacterized protein n=1 Tax=Gracilibacillus halotolerans TaxID=74386 RepID=A0A841RR66_9BACI|nr:hypothetical protein [Gracilibacillus halotolerans]MBB6513424.1 hypothetical protein [Gracilibacillus halotolerans]